MGQHQESSRHACPAATQVTCRDAPADQATSGSSALATTRQSGAAASASRQRRASSQISAARSIWSRLRFSSVTTRGAGRLDHRRNVLLVGLQDRDPGVGGAAERGHRPGVHVRAVDVRRDLAAERGERRRDQPRGRRLAVGAGDEDDLAAGGEQGEQIGLEPQADSTADDRAVALAREPGDRGGGVADRRRELGPDRQAGSVVGIRVHRGRCYPLTGPPRGRSGTGRCEGPVNFWSPRRQSGRDGGGPRLGLSRVLRRRGRPAADARP